MWSSFQAEFFMYYFIFFLLHYQIRLYQRIKRPFRFVFSFSRSFCCAMVSCKMNYLLFITLKFAKVRLWKRMKVCRFIIFFLFVHFIFWHFLILPFFFSILSYYFLLKVEFFKLLMQHLSKKGKRTLHSTTLCNLNPYCPSTMCPYPEGVPSFTLMKRHIHSFFLLKLFYLFCFKGIFFFFLL